MKKAKDAAARTSAPETQGASPRIETQAAEGVRREHARFSVELEVSLGSEHNFYTGLAQNLSAGGVFIATHRMQKVGSKIDVNLRMPDSEETFCLVGEVRWVRVYNEQSDAPPGLGIRFSELPEGATVAINRFLAQREPLLFDED